MGFVSGSADKNLAYWPVHGNQELKKGANQVYMKGHSGAIKQVKRIGEKRVASSSVDGTIRYWNFLTGKQTLSLTDHTGEVTTIENNDKYLCSYSPEDRQIFVRDLPTGVVQTYVEEAQIEGGGPARPLVTAALNSIKFISEETFLASEFKAIRLYDIRKRNQRDRVSEAAATISHKIMSTASKIHFHENSHTVIAFFRGGNAIQTYDLRTCKPVSSFEMHALPINAFCTSTNQLSGVAVTSGMTMSKQKEIAFVDAVCDPPGEVNRVIPGIKTFVTRMDCNEGLVACGNKGGDMRVLGFHYFKSELKTAPASSKIMGTLY